MPPALLAPDSTHTRRRSRGTSAVCEIVLSDTDDVRPHSYASGSALTRAMDGDEFEAPSTPVNSNEQKAVDQFFVSQMERFCRAEGGVTTSLPNLSKARTASVTSMPDDFEDALDQSDTDVANGEEVPGWALLRDVGNLTSAERRRFAGFYLHDVMLNREFYIHRMTPIASMAYRIRSNWLYEKAILVIVVVHLSTVIFEPPSFRQRMDSQYAHNYLGVLLTQLLCIAVYIIDSTLIILDVGVGPFIRKTHSKLRVVLIIIHAVDIFLGTAFQFPRFTRVLRPLLVVVYYRNVRRSFNIIIQTLSLNYNIGFLIVVLILTFGNVGVRLLQGSYVSASGTATTENFDDVASGCLTLFLMLTRKNSPFVMYPAFRVHPAYVLMFIVFLLLGVYLLMTVTLAVVFDFYKRQRKDLALEMLIKKRQALMAAFQLLDDNCNGHVFYDAWWDIVRLSGTVSQTDELERIYAAILGEMEGQFSLAEFFQMSDLLAVRFSRMSANPRCPNALTKIYYRVVPAEKLTTLVEGPYFNPFVIVLVLACTIVVSLNRLDQSDSEKRTVTILYRIFLAVFVVEVSIRILAGPMKFWHSFWNKVDLLNVVVSVSAEVLFFMLSTVLEGNVTDNPDLLRPIIIFRLLTRIGRFRLFMTTLRDVAKTMASVGTVMVLIYYAFAIVGMELFADRLPKDKEVYRNPEVNFDYFGLAMLTLFQLMTMSAWPDIIGITQSATSAYVTWYFVVFNSLVVIIVVNLLVALFLEGFSELMTSGKKKRDIIIAVDDLSGDKREVFKINMQINREDREAANLEMEELHRRTGVELATEDTKDSALTQLHHNVTSMARPSDGPVGDDGRASPRSWRSISPKGQPLSMSLDGKDVENADVTNLQASQRLRFISEDEAMELVEMERDDSSDDLQPFTTGTTASGVIVLRVFYGPRNQERSDSSVVMARAETTASDVVLTLTRKPNVLLEMGEEVNEEEDVLMKFGLYLRPGHRQERLLGPVEAILPLAQNRRNRFVLRVRTRSILRFLKASPNQRRVLAANAGEPRNLTQTMDGTAQTVSAGGEKVSINCVRIWYGESGFSVFVLEKDTTVGETVSTLQRKPNILAKLGIDNADALQSFAIYLVDEDEGGATVLEEDTWWFSLPLKTVRMGRFEYRHRRHDFAVVKESQLRGAMSKLKKRAAPKRRASITPDSMDLLMWFEQFDEDGSQTIDRVELAKLLNGIGYSADVDVDALLAEVDSDGNGVLDFEEFKKFASLLYQACGDESMMVFKEMEERHMMELFRMFDINGDGHIGMSELQLLLETLQLESTGEELDQLFMHLDCDNSGSIDFTEFQGLVRMVRHLLGPTAFSTIASAIPGRRRRDDKAGTSFSSHTLTVGGPSDGTDERSDTTTESGKNGGECEWALTSSEKNSSAEGAGGSAGGRAGGMEANDHLKPLPLEGFQPMSPVPDLLPVATLSASSDDANASSDLTSPRHKTSDLTSPRHKTSDLTSPRRKTSDLTSPRRKTSDLTSPRHKASDLCASAAGDGQRPGLPTWQSAPVSQRGLATERRRRGGSDPLTRSADPSENRRRSSTDELLDKS